MPIPNLLTIDEVADATHAPRSTVLFWIYQGRLAAAKVGRRRLIAETELARFLAAAGAGEVASNERKPSRSAD